MNEELERIKYSILYGSKLDSYDLNLIFKIIKEQQKEIERLQEDNKQIYGVCRDFESDIDFYWSMFHQIENTRLNPSTTDEEKWEKIGELISSILIPNESD